MQNHTSKSQIIICSTDRNDGVSSVPFHSQNLSYSVGDNSKSVIKNRTNLKNSLSLSHILSAKQIHGDAVFIAENPLKEDLEVDGYDALMTSISGIGLMVQQADCQAVTLFDPVNSAIAAIHCGWKGSVLNILAKTTRLMTEHYNSAPDTLQAYISPSLGPCCAEFTNHETELPASFLAFQVKENYFDFWQISKMQLQEAGLNEQHIEIVKKCTSCSPDYFSYRRACREGDGRTGRCATVIALQSK